MAFPGLHVIGEQIVAVANKHEPWEQRHLLRVSDDEEPDGTLTCMSSVVDAKGGVGVVLRVAP